MITCSDSLVEIDQTNKEQSLQTDVTVVSSEIIHNENYYFDDYPYGFVRTIPAFEGGGTFYLQIDRGYYPLNSY